MKRSFILAVSLFLAFGRNATAASIGVNFATDSFPTDYNLAPTDVSGVLPQQNWNNAHESDPSLNNLVDSQGSPTGVR